MKMTDQDRLSEHILTPFDCYDARQRDRNKPIKTNQISGCRPSSFGFAIGTASHGTSCACARRVESEPVKRDEPLAIKSQSEISPRKHKRDGNAPHPTP